MLMSSDKIFTRNTLGLDNRVWRTMIILAGLSLVLLGYTILRKKDRGCAGFTFTILSQRYTSNNVFYYYAGQNISFSSSLAPEEGENISWSFNDGTPDTTKGYYVKHNFKSGGAYRVIAYINEYCSFDSTIQIIEKPKVIVIRDSIEGALFAMAGISEKYTSATEAKSYEWIVLNNEKMRNQVQHERTATFTFEKGGDYTLQLTLNNDKTLRQIIRVQDKPQKRNEEPEPNIAPIFIIPKPAPPVIEEKPVGETPVPPKEEPQKPKAPVFKYINDNDFKDELQEFVNNEREEKDFYRYLCSTGSTRVIINNKNDKPETFSRLCQRLREKRKEIKNVILSRENGCITRIDVKY